jgi:hypothetical protein
MNQPVSNDDYLDSEIITVSVKVKIEWRKNTPGAKEYVKSLINPHQKMVGGHVKYGCYSVETIGDH